MSPYCSDEEEDYPINERSHANWTDQVTISSTSSRQHSEPRDNFDGPQSYGGGGGGRSGIKVKPTSHDNLSFLDDEDQRRTKKNEEVLKNIERARRRRAEEEQKYRVVDEFGGRRSPSTQQQYNSDSYHNIKRRPSPGTYENGVAKSASNNAPFGKFDVGGQTESDDYDSEPKRNDHPSTTHGGRGGAKQSSVPPRFKRQGGELQNYKRSSPPKDRSQHFSGDADISTGDVRSSASRESAESQSQEKDYGALFRQQSNNSNQSASGWGMRHQSGSSGDRCVEDSTNSRFEEGMSSDHHQSSQDESKSRHLTRPPITEMEDDTTATNFTRGHRDRGSNRDRGGKGRGSDKHDDSKHKGSKASDGTKERNQGKRGGGGDPVQTKSERGQQRNSQRGGGGGGGHSNNSSARNHDGKRSSNDHKSQTSSSRNQRGNSKKEEIEFESEKSAPSSQRQQQQPQRSHDQFEEDVSGQVVVASSTSKEPNESIDVPTGGSGGGKDGIGGWFAPRGQPSRRGRGGSVAASAGGRQNVSRTSGNTLEGEVDDQPPKLSRSSNRRSQHPSDEWDESSSERSAGQNDELRVGPGGKDGNRRGGGVDGRSHGRKERSKKQGKATTNEHSDDKRASKHDNDDNTDISTMVSSRNKGRGDRGGGNDRNNRKNEEKMQQQQQQQRSSGQNEQRERRRDERESKQIAFERRQNKLPPRLAKQKEQNRQSGGGGQIQSQMVAEAWGSQSNDLENGKIPPPVGGGVQWDPSVINQQQQYGLSGLQQQSSQAQQQTSLSVGSIPDFENNRALLIQRLRGEEGVMGVGAENMRLDAPGLAVGSGASNVGGLASNMKEAFTSESRENAVQTIIFENTNFKGTRPMGNAVVTTGTDNDKIMFKLGGGGGQDKSLVSGFNQAAKAGEDDLKLDFTFETADIQGSGEGKEVVQGSVTNVRPVSSSSVVATVVSSSQPATADDLNMKIASVKKVWETLPSMSPVPGGGVGGVGTEQSSAIGPFPSNEDKAFDSTSNGYDKDATKMRPQQQTNQVQSHHPPAQASHGQQQVQNQPIPHSVHSQLQQPSSQLHHQNLLQQQQQQQQQQASLDDRVLGRGNMAYNRFPNLQSPPSILGQQPSLYQAFQIDPNRGVTNQLYPYATTGIGGQSLILPPSGSSLSAGNSVSTNTADLFGGPTTGNQFSRQFAGPPPTGTQTSTVMNTGLMSQSSLMTSSMKQSAAAAGGIGPIGTKAGQLGGHNAYQQGGIGSLPASATSPLIIPYDGAFVPRSGQTMGQTAFYQALASQQTTRSNFGFPNQQSLMQQQMMRNQVPPQMPPTYSTGGGKQGGGANNVGLSGLQGRQFTGNSTQHQQPTSIKSTATSLASMSLRGSVLGTSSATTNGTAPTSTPAAQQTTSYSPTPIQRPPVGKGMYLLNCFTPRFRLPIPIVLLYILFVILKNFCFCSK